MALGINDYRNFVNQGSLDGNKEVQVKGDGTLTTDKTSATAAVTLEHLQEAASKEYASSRVNQALAQINLEPGKALTVAELKAALEALDNLGNIDISSIMVELYKVGMNMRSIAQQQAKASLNVQVAETKKQAEQMQESAKQAMWAGIISGTFDIVCGGIQSFGAYRSFNIGSTGGWSEAARTSSNATLQGYSGISQATGGLGKVLTSIFWNKSAQDAQAQSTIHQAQASEASAQRDEMLKFQENMQECMRATLQAMQQAMQSREQTVQKIFA